MIKKILVANRGARAAGVFLMPPLAIRRESTHV
jgi:hypothetical protein